MIAMVAFFFFLCLRRFQHNYCLCLPPSSAYVSPLHNPTDQRLNPLLSLTCCLLAAPPPPGATDKSSSSPPSVMHTTPSRLPAFGPPSNSLAHVTVSCGSLQACNGFGLPALRSSTTDPAAGGLLRRGCRRKKDKRTKSVLQVGFT